VPYSRRELEDVYQSASDYMTSATIERDGFETNAANLEFLDGVVEWEVFTPDPEGTARKIAERFGDAVRLEVLGDRGAVLEPHAWDCYEATSPGRLTIRFLGGPRDSIDRVVVVEDDRTVAVEMWLRESLHDVRGSEFYRADVELESPLGDRVVVDAVTGAPGKPCGDSIPERSD
jgi:hypothetical protein